ncbi:MAG: DUF484 family protein [Pseudomonadota bacterium]
MKPGSGAEDDAINLDDEHVAEYLRRNPEFFARFEDLLGDLELAHHAQGATSLIERQVGLLREENASLKTRLELIVRQAQANETLNSKIHILALRLMRATDPRQIAETLESELGQGFNADRARLLLFADPAFLDIEHVPQFLGIGSSLREPFVALIDGGKPVCGILDTAISKVAFDADFDGSAVTMPLCGRVWDGVLIVASNDAHRYTPDMATDFLTYLADVVTLVLDPWVSRPPKS